MSKPKMKTEDSYVGIAKSRESDTSDRIRTKLKDFEGIKRLFAKCPVNNP